MCVLVGDSYWQLIPFVRVQKTLRYMLSVAASNVCCNRSYEHASVVCLCTCIDCRVGPLHRSHQTKLLVCFSYSRQQHGGGVVACLITVYAMLLRSQTVRPLCTLF
eukprot:scpid41795/ scgid18834/ 